MKILIYFAIAWLHATFFDRQVWAARLGLWKLRWQFYVRRPAVRLYRRLCGRCQSCGRQLPPYIDRLVSNDLYEGTPSFYNCRRCNKTRLWARLYGAGEQKIRGMVEK